jgi:hypothetical protein
MRVFFYCNSGEKRNPRIILGSILRQILLQSHCQPVLGYLKQIFKSQRDTGDVFLDILIDCMATASASATSVFCAIDGIDECECRGLLLQRLIKMACGQFKVLVTSRHLKDIESHLSEMPQLAMDEVAVKHDIDSYIRARFNTDPTLARINSTVKAKINEDLLTLSGGMFIPTLQHLIN